MYIYIFIHTYSPETSGHFSILSYATHCNTMLHTATHWVYHIFSNTDAEIFNLSYATNRNTLRHTATHCNTLRHTATHLYIYVPHSIYVFLKHRQGNFQLELCQKQATRWASIRFSAASACAFPRLPVPHPHLQYQIVYWHVYWQFIACMCFVQPHQHALFRVCHFHTHIFPMSVCILTYIYI